jgi:hypothetical protein
MIARIATCWVTVTSLAIAQNPAGAPVAPKQAEYMVESGTKIPLGLINSVSSKSSLPGDRVYLRTVFPILVAGKVVIPPGSYVAGTVTSVKRPGKVKGRGELYLRFDSLMLPNGVVRDFRSRMGGLEGQNPGQLDRDEGKVTGDGSKGRDAMAIGQAAGWGTVAGGIGGHGTGAAIGAAAGATAGLIGVLFTRGPDAMIERGSVVEMVLDRNVKFNTEELNFPATEAAVMPPIAPPPSRP